MNSFGQKIICPSWNSLNFFIFFSGIAANDINFENIIKDLNIDSSQIGLAEGKFCVILKGSPIINIRDKGKFNGICIGGNNFFNVKLAGDHNNIKRLCFSEIKSPSGNERCCFSVEPTISKYVFKVERSLMTFSECYI